MRSKENKGKNKVRIPEENERKAQRTLNLSSFTQLNKNIYVSPFLGISNNSIHYSNMPKQNRKYRKAVLDAKRGRIPQTSSTIETSMHASDKTYRSPLGDISNGKLLSFRCHASRTSAHISFGCTSTPPSRYPLSDISNGRTFSPIHFGSTSTPHYMYPPIQLSNGRSSSPVSLVTTSTPPYKYPFTDISNGPTSFANAYLPTSTTPYSHISNDSRNDYLNSSKHNRQKRKMLMAERKKKKVQVSLHISSSSQVINPSSTVALNDNSNAPTSSLSVSRDAIRKGKRKVTDLSPIRMGDLTSDEEVDIHHDNEPTLYDFFSVKPFIETEYLDHGDQSTICDACQSKLWKDECVNSRKNSSGRSYSFCCGFGKVELPDLKQPEESYVNLFKSSDVKSRNFVKNIRRYNSMFSFTSMGGKIDKKINKGRGPFTFRLSGENYHRIGTLLPQQGETPKFSQLYIYDTENELSNRQSILCDSDRPSTSSTSQLELEIIQQLKHMLDSQNQLVKTYRMVRDIYEENPTVDLKLRLIGRRSQDGRKYNLPSASEVAALIIGDFEDNIEPRDIVVRTTAGSLQRISELHPSYLALQYPLLFPFGEDCYHVDILHRDVILDQANKRNKKCTMREYFCYRIQDRVNRFSLILNSRRLFQQFLVDAYTMIEAQRLWFVRNKQSTLRCTTYNQINDAQNLGDTDLSNKGQRVILPSSFTGGARYMLQNYLDAMSICKWYGYPDFFITMTCNPKWPEMTRYLADTSLRPEDKPNILSRLFKMKLDSLITDLKKNSILGRVQAVVYTVEFQKRGLPHAHICLFMHPDNKIPCVENVDPYISAEIPDKDEDPELYELVSEFMIHGPCGSHNMKSPCMNGKDCTKRFPKDYRDYTSVDTDGYPLYRRREGGPKVLKSGHDLDCRYVVPYNKVLLKRYQAHINTEWCNQGNSIKYLFKYINKGPDRASVKFVANDEHDSNGQPVDEVKAHFDCRYVSACEAAWRIQKFDVHYRTPSVFRLPFHLPGQQQVVFHEDDDMDEVMNKPSAASTKFNSWMECNKIYPEAKDLTYVEFPTKFVWVLDRRSWQPRKQGFSLGRIHSVSPSLGELYFLRILLNKVKGPTSFEDIRTFNGVVHPTFRDACYARGLLDDDREYIEGIQEASFYGTGPYLRNLFVTMLLSNSLSRPEIVWENSWTHLSDGILKKQRLLLKSPALSYKDDQLKNLTLSEIEKVLHRHNSSLTNYPTMPFPDNFVIDSANNVLINEQLDYDTVVQESEYDRLYASLTDEQRSIFQEIMHAVDKDGGVFFVYGYGGTGKTFLWNTLSTAIRSKGQIVITVASSGIASLLLPGGRTAHSRFHIPLNVTEDSLCSMSRHSDISDLLQQTKLIIWDEAPMIHKHAFEALDKSLKDVLCTGNNIADQPLFGGKVVVFGGDFRQILPVLQGASNQDVVTSCLTSSYIWRECKVLRLTKNMRLLQGNDPSEIEETADFARWLLDIGEGKVGGDNDGESDINIPYDLLIDDSSDPVSDLIEFVYPSLLDNFGDRDFWSERAVLAPTNEVVDDINNRLLSLVPGEEHEYLSSDSVCQDEMVGDSFDRNLYSPDVLNSLHISGIPNHRLVLKVGVPVMLLRNIDQRNGLCNGTRLQIVALGRHVIEAVIISGSNIGFRTFIPRLSLVPTDKKIAFRFQRRQFPISVCFAMTINKSQGQSLSRVGLYLKAPVFSHGQLYVALSRVKSKKGLKILILDEDGRPTNVTKNIVYKSLFSNL
ncbi:hypothetical protein SSX86_027942 [Deinandra increscens subsp. villosa]|uniref:ATP-dependent DNA helicase n=1 Tax=Deinandra increscens subsp. villosa TaxID=3103831 RepID=A0AAP0GKU7_9ASTR